VFEHLAVHRKILVTGSFRSGTTIAGKMIAHDTGHCYLDESAFIGRRRRGRAKLERLRWARLIWGTRQLTSTVNGGPDEHVATGDRRRHHRAQGPAAASGVVAQCPQMFRMIVDDPPADALVVLVRRNLADIHRSVERLGFSLSAFGWDAASKRDYPRAVYDYWDSAPKPPWFLELDYESLSAHPLFVSEGLRADFSIKQTAIGDTGPVLGLP
jgi:hypothetical protein